jgi:hypothetical protein
VSEPRIQPVTSGGRCIGHIIRSARGSIAYDARDVQIGTYRTSEDAVAAISKHAGEGEGAPGLAPR